MLDATHCRGGNMLKTCVLPQWMSAYIFCYFQFSKQWENWIHNNKKSVVQNSNGVRPGTRTPNFFLPGLVRNWILTAKTCTFSPWWTLARYWTHCPHQLSTLISSWWKVLLFNQLVYSFWSKAMLGIKKILNKTIIQWNLQFNNS